MLKKLDKFAIVKNPKLALKIFQKHRWQPTLYCPHCGCVNDILKHSKLKSGLFRYFCTNCEKTFCDTTGTIFSNSKIPIWKWLYVLIILFEATGSISAAEVSRTINVSYKSAWNMMHKIRSSLKWDRLNGTLHGLIESDQAFVSHKHNKQALQGIVERQGKVKIFPIKDVSEVSVMFPHYKYIEKDSFLATDSHVSHSILSLGFNHHCVNHSKGQFAWRNVHTNTIEGVWSMLKGILRTIHHGVSKKYLIDYCNLFSFMYSFRFSSPYHKFSLLFKKLCQPRYCI